MWEGGPFQWGQQAVLVAIVFRISLLSKSAVAAVVSSSPTPTTLLQGKKMMLPLVVVLGLALLAVGVCTLQLPNMRPVFFKHSDKAAEEYLLGLNQAEYNHDHAFQICTDDDAVPPQFVANHRRVRVGRGAGDFVLASQILLNFSFIDNMQWASVVRVGDGKKTGAVVKMGEVVGTLVNCYKVAWSLNPCRITCRGERISSASTPRSSQIAFSTIRGHLLEGEERFRVDLDREGGVYLDMFSYSRGHGLLGKLAFPLIRPLQRSFFRGLEVSFLQLMGQQRPSI